jgi:hypothetical protein
MNVNFFCVVWCGSGVCVCVCIRVDIYHFTLSHSRTLEYDRLSIATVYPRRDPIRGHCQAGSLTGAVHLSKNNAGVLRPAQRGQKPRVEQKGKSWLDLDVQYA